MRHKHSNRSGSTTAGTSIRDAYGFEVKKDMLSLYNKYAPLWEKEEVERSERWDAFLAHFEGALQQDSKKDNASASALELLEQACQGWPTEERGAGHGLADWQHQLRSLVQAGIPMTLRGKMWRTFLGLEAVKKEGYYEQLVFQALGNKYNKRKDKSGLEENAEASNESQQGGISTADTVGSPVAAQVVEQAEVVRMADAAAANAPAPAPAPARDTQEAAPKDPSDAANTTAEQCQEQGSRLPGAASSDTDYAQIGSQLLSLSSESLSALPTPLHPAAVPPAVAQDLNNALARSLLREPQTSGLTDAEVHSTRLTSAYSEAASSELSSKVAVGWHPSSRDWNLQIEKDLHRTFPGHPVMDGTGRSALRRILAAYARRNPTVGYCQGMNFIAGCLLLFMDEEDTFWCLAIIVEELLPGYYSMAMVEPQVDQLVFKELVEEGFPRLSSHLEGHAVNVSSVSTNWFLCIFVNSLPLESCLRVWDIFFLECCSSVLFRVALALVDIYSQALVATTDSVDAFSLLQNMAPMSYDSSRLIDVACISFSTTDHAHLASLQARHRQTVMAQFASHGQPEEEDGWASSDANSEGVQRSAHSTPHAGSQGPFSIPAEASTSQAAADLQVTNRSLSAIVTKPKHRQLRLASRVLAGSPQAHAQGDSPHSQPSSAAGSPWSTVSSPDWHSTPRWPQYANFAAHSSRPAHPSMLYHSSSAHPALEHAPVQEAELVGRSGMDEAEYEAAAAQTAQLAAQLPRIGIATRPAPGPSMPQRLINRFRNQEAVLGEQLRTSLPRSSSGVGQEPREGAASEEAPSTSRAHLTLTGTPTPSPSPAAYAAAALHPAAWGVQRTRLHGVHQPPSPQLPPPPPPTPQVAAASQMGPSTSGSVQWHEEAAQQTGLEAQTSSSPVASSSGQGQDRGADEGSSSQSILHLRLPHLLTTLTRAPSDELASSSRASSQIPAHSALSRLLHDSNVHERSHIGDVNQEWTMVADEGQQVAGGNSPDSAALQQLLHVVEGLEEELFSSESRRNDAETQAEALKSSVQELQQRLVHAQQDLVLKQQTVEGLTRKFDRGAVSLGEADAQLAEKQVALVAAKAQLAANDRHLLSQDATIAKLIRKQGQPEGLGAAFLRNLQFPFRRGARQDQESSTEDQDQNGKM